MKKRLNYYVLILFASLSLISIGFASWNIRDPNDRLFAVENNEITSEDVYNTSDYLKLNNVKISKFFPTGFVKDEDEINTNAENKKIDDFISNSGYVKMSYTFDAKSLYEQYKWNYIEIGVTLQQINSVFVVNNKILCLFNDYFDVEFSCKIYGDNVDISDDCFNKSNETNGTDNYSCDYNLKLCLDSEINKLNGKKLNEYDNIKIDISFNLIIKDSSKADYTQNLYKIFANNSSNDMFSIISTLKEGENNNEKE